MADERPRTTLPLEDWTKGNPLSAEKLSQPVEVLRQLTGGVAIPRQVPVDAPIPKSEPSVPDTKFVVVRNIIEGADKFITVQVVKPDVSGCTWTGNFAPIGGDVTIGVWPGQRASDFKAFLWPQASPINWDETPILAAIKVNGCWWLPQYLRYRLASPSLGIPFGDCTPHIGAPSP